MTICTADVQIPVLAPDQPYDRDGVFTGCFVPNGPKGEPDQLTVFYTSISALPVHYTLLHVRGSEGLSLASFSDGGRTCTCHRARADRRDQVG